MMHGGRTQIVSTLRVLTTLKYR